MAEPIRCFVAVKFSIQESLRPVLSDLSAMGRALKVAAPDHLHVTLKFLGDTDPNLVPQIQAAVVAMVRKRRPCTSRIVGLGVFPHLRRPSVVWAGLAGEGAETLSSLAQDLQEGLEAFGFPREERPFTPHLTLARVKAKPPEALRELLARHAQTPFGTSNIDEIELIQSELGRQGSRYTVLGVSPLGRADSRQRGNT